MDDLDRIAQQVAVAGVDATVEPLDMDTLLAYREGRLDADQTTRVERALPHDPAARAFLAELHDPAPSFLLRWAQAQRPRRRARWIAGGVLLAAAAVLVLALRPSVRAPDYTIGAVRGGHADMRGDRDASVGGVLIIDDESVLSVALVPTGAHDGVLPKVRVFVGDLAVDAEVTPGAGGAIRVRLAAKAFPRPGEYSVRLALAFTPSTLSTPHDSDAVRWLTFTVRRVDRP